MNGESAPTALDQPLGVGDGAETVLAIIKRYADTVTSYDRPIAWPVAGSVVVAVDGVPLDPAAFTVQRGAGTVTFNVAPAAAAVLTCGFAFDVPVHFVEDVVSVVYDAPSMRSVGSIPIEELRGENV